MTLILIVGGSDRVNESDESLVISSQSGDRAAFEELVRRTARGLFARLYLETGDTHQAEDLVQETYLHAWKKLHQLTDAKGFRGWLFTVAHTVMLDSIRRRGRKKRTAPTPVETPSSSETPLENAQRQELRQRVLSRLRAMPDRLRLPLTLRFIAGADYESISKELGLTNGSLRGLLSRGLAQLREVFRDEVE
jgi:RNA polymerase sigma-70 factor (ECF subfamily)